MLDEEKIKKDLEKMRVVYSQALKDLEEIGLRQEKIMKEIYEAKQKKLNSSQQ